MPHARRHYEGSTFRWIRPECADCGASSGEVRKHPDEPINGPENRRRCAVDWNRRPAITDHGPEALTAQGLLSALEADTLTGTQRAALAAMIRGRENG